MEWVRMLEAAIAYEINYSGRNGPSKQLAIVLQYVHVQYVLL
jgi:hypothetical protein